MLVVTTLGWATLQTARFMLPPLLPEIQADLGLTLGQAGIILTVLQGVYGLSQYPGGSLSDSWTRTTLIIPALGILAFGCILIGSATSFLLLLFGTAVFGVGKGLFAIPSRALLSDLFVEHRGRALGVYGAASDIGGAIASLLAVAIFAVATWRTVFFPLAIGIFGLAVLFAVWTKESYTVHETDLDFLSTIRRLLATPKQRRILVAYTLFYFMVNGVLNFLPTYLREVKGLSPELASVIFAILFIAGASSKPIIGSVSDRFPRQFVAIAGIVICAIMLSLLLIFESVVGIIVVICLFAASYKGQLPVIDAILMDVAPDGKMGHDLGAARTLFIGVGSLGPTYVGFVTGLYSYTVAFSFFVVCLIVAAAVLAW